MRRLASVLGVQIVGTAQRSGKTARGCEGGWIAGSGRIFPEPGFDQNTVRHSGNVDGKRDLTASEEAGSEAGLGKKTMFGISFTVVRDAGLS